ncbi:MAG: 4-hydroxythreonine-4-phosphate dehydrogenase PdxA [Pseudomonadota bacterium]|nr:4-hydroxythreonine-4-phosphate dehydrogenase PdxA [Pseudomonadota bacterium]
MSGDRPIVVTMGDPAGIGGEIALLAWRDHRSHLPPFCLFDDPGRLRRLARLTGIDCLVTEIEDPSDATAVLPNALPVIPLSRPVLALPGQDSTADGAMVIEAIDRSIDAAMKGNAAGMTTNPIQKSRLYEAGFTAPGHTEYLGERSGLQAPPVMLLAGPNLKVVPVTIHLSLKDAISALTTNEIVRTLEITIASLRYDFGIPHPRIAVSGLNPHAGESGHMGREEIDIISPAIEHVKEPGLDMIGPLAGDTMFHEAARGTYDVAVCMYHDQALIPMKTLDFENGVNISVGLPFVRTSPDHGTAYNIAGTGTANPKSLISAIRMAAQIASCRERTLKS